MTPIAVSGDITERLAWERFWVPRESRISLFGDGYLPDPTSEIGRLLNPDVVALGNLREAPCLVLLGEPGMGKSTAIGDAVAVIRAASDGVTVLHHHDLKPYGSEDRLVREVFRSPEVQAWAAGHHTLHLVLDSVDECLLRINTLADLIANELQRLQDSAKRLRLWIACRTAEWPANLEEALRTLWEGKVGVYELAPLTQANVATAARAYRIDVQAFFAEVDRVEAGPLVTKPVTLHFLLRMFRRDSRLPRTQQELYLEGCQLLCEEASPSRRGAKLLGSLNSHQRLAIASRIAAVMVFCNRATIATDVGKPLDGQTEVAVADTVGGTELVDGGSIDVTEAAIRETLSTGLFSSRGLERLGWAHQTYAEFLAAHYLHSHAMPLPQIRSLLMHGEHGQYVVPQLHETAAWASGMIPSVLLAIMKSDPQVLLRSDVAAASETTREQLVQALLEGLDAHEIFDSIQLYGSYRKLDHPRLATQLEPYIRDVRKDVVVRRFAIDLAEACRVTAHVDLLTNIALDARENPHIRDQAAYAIARIGDSNSRLKLQPLLNVSPPEDPDDQLKGTALLALWPGLISAAELFGGITPQQKTNLHGAYASFLGDKLVDGLQGHDLPIALAWAKQQPPHHDPVDRTSQLADEILAKAWDYLDEPGVFPLVVEMVVARMKNHIHVVDRRREGRNKGLWSWDDPRRLRLAERIVARAGGDQIDPGTLVYGASPLVKGDDLTWLIHQITASTDPTVRRVWAGIIRHAFLSYPHKSGDLEAVLLATSSIPELSDEFGDAFEPVALDSDRANRGRADREQWRRLHEQERPLLDPPPMRRVMDALARFDAGDPDGWWQANKEMTLEARSTRYENIFEADLTKLPVWKDADAPMRARILAAAKQYVYVGNPASEDWFGQEVFHHPAAAGYRAILLLNQLDAEGFSSVPSSVWSRWIPIIVAYPASGMLSDAEKEVVQEAFRQAPQRFIEQAKTLLELQKKEHGTPAVLQKLSLCWDDRLRKGMEEGFELTHDNFEKQRPLLEALLEAGSTSARNQAEALIPSPLPAADPARQVSLRAGRILLEHVPETTWAPLWRAMNEDVAWGKEFALSWGRQYGPAASHLAKRLGESELGDLYIWLERFFPRAEDPEPPGEMHQFSDREMLSQFRQGILRELQGRGTTAACQKISRIIQLFPEQEFLRWVLVDATQTMVRRTWAPPQPAALLKIARDAGARLVETGMQLLEVIRDSLERWQAKLQGTTPLAFRLWDRVGKKGFRPKEEDKLSDEVASHLNDDLRERGVVVNREVVIRNGERPGGKGERTDIHVTATRQDSHGGSCDQVVVIIEAKGCWNDELNTAMESQLRDRYLKDNQCQHGLYLVGWYVCPHWERRDRRRAKVPKITLTTAQRRFDRQAQALSLGGVTLKAFVANTALR